MRITFAASLAWLIATGVVAQTLETRSGEVWRDAGRRTVLYRDKLLPKGQAALEVSRTSYANNRTDVTALLDAERGLRTYRVGAARARMDRESAWARIVYQLVSEGPGTEGLAPDSRSGKP